MNSNGKTLYDQISGNNWGNLLIEGNTEEMKK